MRWQYFESEQEPELAPDLEWMLQSGQVSQTLLVHTILEEHYAALFYLSHTFTGDENAAREVVRKTLHMALQRKHAYRNGIPVEAWLHRIVWKVARVVYQRETAWQWLENILRMPGEFTHQNEQSSDPFEQRVSIWLDSLPAEKRFLILGYELHNWTDEHAAAVTDDAESKVQSQRQKMLDDLDLQTVDLGGDFETRHMHFRSVLQKRWPKPSPEEFTAEVEKLSKKLERLDRRTGSVNLPTRSPPI